MYETLCANDGFPLMRKIPYPVHEFVFPSQSQHPEFGSGEMLLSNIVIELSLAMRAVFLGA